MATKDFSSMMKSNPRNIKLNDTLGSGKSADTATGTAKKAVGRPPIDPDKGKKKEYTKTVNIAIPLDTLERMQIAKARYNNNLTEYINKLIEKDLAENFDKYQEIYNMLNS